MNIDEGLKVKLKEMVPSVSGHLVSGGFYVDGEGGDVIFIVGGPVEQVLSALSGGCLKGMAKAFSRRKGAH